MAPSKAAISLSLEREFQSQIVAEAKRVGWEPFYVYDSRRSPKGWPDLTLCKPPRLIFAELKRIGEYPSPEQVAWLERLRGCPGHEVYLWRPSDWDEIRQTLARR